jgi:hypothetical protein
MKINLNGGELSFRRLLNFVSFFLAGVHEVQVASTYTCGGTCNCWWCALICICTVDFFTIKQEGWCLQCCCDHGSAMCSGVVWAKMDRTDEKELDFLFWLVPEIFQESICLSNWLAVSVIHIIVQARRMLST